MRKGATAQIRNIPDSDQGKIQRRVMEWFRHSKARYENEEKWTHRSANLSLDE